MRFARDLIEYEMLDTSGGEKLERWGDRILIRPDPQIIWDTPREHPLWNKADARYFRSSKGGGKWEVYKKMPESWILSYRSLRFRIQPTGFKHTGLFPEQAVNWAYFMDIIQKQKKPVRVLNLFAYTGGATLACASAGAEVCHVDASKGMVSWARENAALSGLSQRQPLDRRGREKFVARETNAAGRYDVIIMDPPSYGRGPGGEVWKLEEQIYRLVDLCVGVLSETPLLFVLNSYTTGLSPSVMQYLLGVTVANRFGGRVSAEEIGLPVTQSGQILRAVLLQYGQAIQ